VTIEAKVTSRFDAPSVFASTLDADRGGSFDLAADASTHTKQFYFPDTTVLITRFFADDGVGESRTPCRSSTTRARPAGTG
jgi:GH15 family glucan-1,4-alpha-glucosidase